MRGGTVAVIGGSIAGCAVAAAVARAGAGQVTVLERTRGRLADRGVGLCVHDERAVELRASGALPVGIAAHPLQRRRWVVRDDAEGAGGRLIWQQPFPFHSYHWALAGDAAGVVRPHNTSGAAKALQDATALADGWRRSESFEELLDGYHRARGAAGRELVALARRLGRAQVERTPAWAAMDGDGMAAWWRGQLDGAPGIGGRAMAP
ncbi:hypothetical protein AB0N09_27045 [Streptomyces erythrochromogenes]|uniref:hypothetical protein n=1 Tax=Streptomyces erythrochromogenes TaxID=285574 RepID=UPI0034426FDC